MTVCYGTLARAPIQALKIFRNALQHLNKPTLDIALHITLGCRDSAKGFRFAGVYPVVLCNLRNFSVYKASVCLYFPYAVYTETQRKITCNCAQKYFTKIGGWLARGRTRGCKCRGT